MLSDKNPFGLFALWRAYRACRKGKRTTRDTQRYEARLLDHLVSSRDALARFAWRPSRTLAFVVSSPKLREIHAAPFADRVVHHLLTDRLARIYEPVFIHDSYANRVGKGTHAAVDRLQAFMRQAEGGRVATAIAAKACPEHDEVAAPTPMCPAEGFVGAASAANNRAEIAAVASSNPAIAAKACPEHDEVAAPTRLAASGVYALQLDIANFFNSIHRPTLFSLLQQRLVRAVRRQGLEREEANALQAHCRALLQADPAAGVRRKGSPGLFEQVPPHKRLGALGPGVGLPIGNLTSQFFANVYLNELDQFVKHTLKARWYVRYVDDFVLLHADPAQLLAWRGEIERFLAERLRLKLKVRAEPKPVAAGVDFLGYVIRPFYKLVRRRVIHRLYARLAEFERRHVRPNALRLPPVARDLLRAQIASYLGHLRHAHAHRLWLRTLERFPWLARIFDQPETDLGALPVGGGLPPKGFIAAAPARGMPAGSGSKAARTGDKAAPLRPAWEPAAVSGLAGQYRAFTQRYPAACVLMQVGKNWLAAGEQATPLFRQPGMAPTRRPGLGDCLEYPAYRLAQVRQKLKRAAITHILVAQTGTFKTGFKRRAMILIWRPTHDPLNPFLSSSHRGPT
ncbi:MAG: RNA-directed DNA polymerase [Gallionella sp.]|nr:RNA-directed DNA polymerase [Gallionella sp.]